ncbi:MULTISPECIES: protein phosphatase CheZ [Nitrospirillum]|uniref:Chemotaxis protein CheZ n=1 Tax=Nitrospirillum amazonense TaxID=28077 RepID=A0A560GAF0_9PROT|nr:protein phosphatase CheZ [Nitrospirillum amazonense]MEC4595294.1 protein phosphatase CheZ [Nitrospirillum amazonense]TWB30680.1 chemotaxis protein CheZ [Nitrospirillum amazonense]
MIRPAADPILQDRLDAARSQARQPLSREEVAQIVSTVVASMGGDVTQHDIKLYGELEGLARFIHNAKKEIAALQPSDIHAEHIPRATDELDAVVGATEDATNRIMDACDQLMGMAGDVTPEVSSKMMDITTGIYEACNFQDITGQRITKVVKALKHIEAKVEAMLVAFGEDVQRRHPDGPPAADTPAGGASDDNFLLHGPQLPGRAIDQDEIDRLLASFD